jgi:DNA-binding NarL/FixJ family response regulator
LRRYDERRILEIVVAARREDLQAALDYLCRAEAADAAAMPPKLVDLLRALVEEEAKRLSACRALSNREREVLAQVEEGKTNAEIAAVLAIAPTTVRTHLEHIYRKLQVHSRTAALARSRRDAVTLTEAERFRLSAAQNAGLPH